MHETHDREAVDLLSDNLKRMQLVQEENNLFKYFAYRGVFFMWYTHKDQPQRLLDNTHLQDYCAFSIQREQNSYISEFLHEMIEYVPLFYIRGVFCTQI